MASDLDTFPGTTDCLAKMLDFGAGQQPLWASAELGAIFQHQMNSPLEPDLAQMDPTLRDRIGPLTVGGEPLHTFGDLFRHPHPPLELLQATKQFAKYSRTLDESLPRELATVLYFLAIAAAWTKHRRRITALDGEPLLNGLAWARQQPWLDEPSRAIVVEAEGQLRPDSPVRRPGAEP